MPSNLPVPGRNRRQEYPSDRSSLSAHEVDEHYYRYQKQQVDISSQRIRTN
jgi:hypothetical protein